MKFKLAILLVALLIPGVAVAEEQIWTPDLPIWGTASTGAGATVGANDSITSQPIQLSTMTKSGFFGGSLVVTDDGTLTVDVQVSHDPDCMSAGKSGTFYKPEDTATGLAFEVVNGWTKTSGNASSGAGAVAYPVVAAECLRFVAIETGASDDADIFFRTSVVR